ncbi:hypothetical protein HDU92_005634 [Lobulomyces angularis]|nr:hypothetical protein HDU92_005634 [Lobulomyces angularis]
MHPFEPSFNYNLFNIPMHLPHASNVAAAHLPCPSQLHQAMFQNHLLSTIQTATIPASDRLSKIPSDDGKQMEIKCNLKTKLDSYKKLRNNNIAINYLQKPRINQIAERIKKRLRFARFKVFLGWEKYTFDQVSDLYQELTLEQLEQEQLAVIRRFPTISTSLVNFGHTWSSPTEENKPDDKGMNQYVDFDVEERKWQQDIKKIPLNDNFGIDPKYINAGFVAEVKTALVDHPAIINYQGKFLNNEFHTDRNKTIIEKKKKRKEPQLDKFSKLNCVNSIVTTTF